LAERLRSQAVEARSEALLRDAGQAAEAQLALLQRLTRPHLPRRRDGELMGPEPVWLNLLQLLECWCREHLNRPIRALRLLRSCYGNMANQPPDPA
jgi:DNA repair protein RecO (recombination protein O)